MRPVLQKLAALAVTSLTCLCASAYDFDTGGIYYNITNATAKEVEVTFGDNRYTGDITVPSTVTYNNEQYTVTAIGNEAFRGCSDLTSITLPNSVTSIGGEAFYYCYNLTSITLPNSVTAIGNEAFSSCNGLTSITIPNSVTTIGNEAFSSCNGLTSITIPNSVTTIGEGAFAYCRGLTSINVDSDNLMYSSVDGILYDKAQTCLIQCPAGKTGEVIVPNSVTTIGNGAFSGCDGLNSITLPNSVTAIGDFAFSGCDGLTSITLPNFVTSIGGGAFYYCYVLTSIDVDSDNLMYSSVDGILYDKAQTCLICCPAGKTGDVIVPNTVTAIGEEAFYCCSGLTSITLPNSLATIGEGAFSNCRGLTSITIPNSVTAIGNHTFSNCRGLTSITLPNSLTTIGEVAFYHCDGLTSITLPSSATSIGNRAFDWCSGLTSITSYAVTPPGCGEFAFALVDKQKCAIMVPAESVDAYKQAPVWKDFAYIDEIGTVRFFEVDGIRYIVTDKSTLEVEVTSGKNNYSGDIVVPSTVTYKDKQYTVTAIGDYAFSFCDGLTSITLPNSVTTIGNRAFDCCDGLTSVTLPNSLVTIEEETFSNCKGLTSITLPSSVKTIGSFAFAWCSITSITSQAVTPPECTGNTFIGVDKKCSLFVPAESIDDYKQATGWKDFLLIKEIEDANSFEVDGIYYNITDNTAKEVEVTSGENKYSGNIAVPSTVTYNNKTYTVTAIGRQAFANCRGLTSITLPNSLTTIGIQAFYDCRGLTSITLPNSVTAIRNKAFSSCRSLTSVTSLAIVPPVCDTYTFGGVDVDNCTLYVPAESMDAYKEAPVWKEFGAIEEADPALGIGSIEADTMTDEDVKVFNLNGAKVSDTIEDLPAGIYIVRNGLTVRKIVIR